MDEEKETELLLAGIGSVSGRADCGRFDRTSCRWSSLAFRACSLSSGRRRERGARSSCLEEYPSTLFHLRVVFPVGCWRGCEADRRVPAMLNEQKRRVSCDVLDFSLFIFFLVPGERYPTKLAFLAGMR